MYQCVCVCVCVCVSEYVYFVYDEMSLKATGGQFNLDYSCKLKQQWKLISWIFTDWAVEEEWVLFALISICMQDIRCFPMNIFSARS